jgi:hypothetical protein
MNARRLTLAGLVSLSVLAGSFVLGSVTAWAAAPTVGEESSSNLGSSAVTVSAQIGGGGLPTIYRVEYGAGTVGESSTSEATAGAPEGAVGVTVQLSGLEPGTEYRFRFVAANSNGSAQGQELLFVTAQSSGPSASVLPDDRAYELVSPVGNPGEVYMPQGPSQPEEDAFTQLPFRTSPDGNAVVYVGDPAATGGSGSIGKGLGDEFFASRGTAGWSATDIQPAGVNSQGENYKGFSEDLSFGVVKAGPSLASDVVKGCEALYSRATSGGGFDPLFTQPGPEGVECGEPVYAGASADGSHLIFQDAAALTAGTVEAPGPCGGPIEGNRRTSCNLYDFVDGQLRLVNVLPDGEAAPSATFGGRSPEEEEAFRKQPDLDNVISSDGSRIFWTDLEPGPDMGHIFVRENDTQPQSPLGSKEECLVPADACTVAVSLGAGQYWTASKDSRYVIYSEGERLLRFDLDSGAREELVGAGTGLDGVVGVSDDGSYVYFVASGVLANNENSEKEEAKARTCVPLPAQEQEISREFYGEGSINEEEFTKLHKNLEKEEGEEEEGLIPLKTGCNLYLVQAGKPAEFIATLSPGDNRLPGGSLNQEPYGDWQADMGARTAEVSPDGRHLVFQSRHRLTGYDNHFFQSLNGGDVALKPEVEVFVYDKDSQQLSCASCDPNGTPPGEEPDGATFSSGHAPTFLPVSSKPTFMHRWVTDDGNYVFFDTSQALVAQDVNGLQDVYEWERGGAPGCDVQVHPRLNDGCVYLLSGGGSTDFSYLVDASASGNDVFFTTRGQLLPTDGNEKVDLYDARVGGGFPEVSLGCTGTGCQGVPPAAPIFATPSSVTFAGVGNFEPQSKASVKPRSKPKKCKRGFVRRRGKCVKVKAKKATGHSGRSKGGRRS